MRKLYVGLILSTIIGFTVTWFPSIYGSGNALVFDDQKTFRFYAQPYSYTESVTHHIFGFGYCSIHWGEKHNLTGPVDMYLYPNGPSTAFPTPTDNITDFPSSLINNCNES